MHHSAYYSDRVVIGCKNRWRENEPLHRRVFNGIDLRCETYDLTFRTAATCVTLIVDAGVDPHQFVYHGQSTDLTPFEYAMVRRPAFLPTFLSAGVAVPDDVQRTIDDVNTAFEESRHQFTMTEVGRERIRASTKYLESVSAAGGYRLYAAHRRKELIDLLAIILNKRVPQRPLAGIVDYSRVPGARGLELRADRPKEISFLCSTESYCSV